MTTMTAITTNGEKRHIMIITKKDFRHSLCNTYASIEEACVHAPISNMIQFYNSDFIYFMALIKDSSEVFVKTIKNRYGSKSSYKVNENYLKDFIYEQISASY